MEHAACSGRAPRDKRVNPHAVDPWFPENGQSPNLGKVICMTECKVRAQCDDYRTRTESKEGIWAGTILSRKKKS